MQVIELPPQQEVFFPLLPMLFTIPPSFSNNFFPPQFLPS